jgi:RimJ/RimL family protein N-acetyltransferase
MEQVAELGYYIHPAHSGKKVMQAAGRKLLHYAVSDFRIRTVYSSVDIRNPASARVIESLSRETTKGEVVKGSRILSWPVEKKVEGRGEESPSQTWMWDI